MKKNSNELFSLMGRLADRLWDYPDRLIWSVRGRRSRIDRARMRKHLDALGCRDGRGSRHQEMRLLVHVAFHFVPDRTKYLREAVAQLAALPFGQVDVVVDTNADDALPQISALPGVKKVNVWKGLEDPFKLTWMHRKEIEDRLEEYDVFMYVEDDILIPEPTISRWSAEVGKLGRYRFVPGFVRVEENRAGALVLSDFRFPLDRADVVTIEGVRYLATPFPYQACWIYEKAEMRRFVSAPSYGGGAVHTPPLEERDGALDVRESVAVGAVFDDVPPGFVSRTLVPLTEDLRIAPDALIFHMPSNYGLLRPPGHPAGLGVVKVSDWLARSGRDGGIREISLPKRDERLASDAG
jgi:hypothetical protein